MGESSTRGFVERWVPGVALVRRYRLSDLPHDSVAGFVLAGLLVPQGMAYAQLAGLPPITGLYASVAALVAYCLVGPSRILVLGPDSSLGPLIAAAVLPLAAGDPAQAAVFAAMIAVMVGVLSIGLGLGKFGFIADLLSKPVRVGYLAGLGVVIFVGQLPKLFGFSVAPGPALDQWEQFLVELPTFNALSLSVGLAVTLLIVQLRKHLPMVPNVLIAVVGAMVATWAFGLDHLGLTVVGPMPRGLPMPAWPSVDLHELATLATAAGGISLVALADTITTAAGFAGRHGEDVDANHELFAAGAANVMAGLFQGFPVSGSGSRTAVSEAAGARTQMSGVMAAVFIALLLMLVPGIGEYLPQSALAAIVIVAAGALIDVRELRRFYRVRRTEFIQALTAVLGVIAFGALVGMAVAVLVSVLNFFRRAWWPHDAVLGKVEGTPGFHDMRFHPSARQVPGLIVYRFDAPLFFANARAFHDRVHELITASLTPVQWFVVAAGPVTDLEATAADMLLDLDGDLRSRGIKLVFAEVKDPVRVLMQSYKLDREISEDSFFPTIHAAVKAYRTATGVRDYEDPEEAVMPLIVNGEVVRPLRPGPYDEGEE